MEPMKNAKDDKRLGCKNKDTQSQKMSKNIMSLALGWGGRGGRTL